MIRSLTVLAALLATLLVPLSPGSAGPHPDADHYAEYFPANDGFATNLYADILRPKGMPLDAEHKTPVIMAVTPYGNHSGSVSVLGPYDPMDEAPNERFYDFLNLSGALTKGYTYIQVDLPGFGGSSGCNDWGGYREQTAVKAAVEWAASRPWSNGKVGLLGKSYDGWTGLMGISQQPEGLAAVVSLEPVFAGYRYYYNNGVRFLNSVATPAIFQVVDATPGTTNDTPMYHANGAPQAWCYGVNMAIGQIDDPDHEFWRERDLLISSVGEDTPLFLTQGFLERNTKPDGAFDYWNGLDLEHSRAWFGQFDHCRAWETGSACGSSGGGGGSRLAVGREGFIDEVMRFLDEHLKGIEPEVQDPNVVVQDNRGMYRAETQWPPEDASMYWSDLNTGTYTDDATVGSERIWSFTAPLEHDVWLSGEPVVKVQVDAAVPRGNIVVDTFDVAPDGQAVLINRGTYLLRQQGNQFATFDLYGQDWRVPAGHRIGVMISDTDGPSSGFWTHVPTGQDIEVIQARIGLPFLYWERDAEEYLDGGSTPRLEGHLSSGMDVSSLVDSGEREFELPGPLVERPDDEEGGGGPA